MTDAYTKVFLINGGKDTARSFAKGLSHLPLTVIQSKRMLLHLNRDGETKFVYEDTEQDFRDSYVFTRLRAADNMFCGILYEYFKAHNIPASDPINLSFRDSEEKIAQMARFVRAGIRIPDTIILREEAYEANKSYLEQHLSYPLVYKTDGSKGRNVHLVHSQEELETLISEKEPTKRFLLQEVIENTYDTRTLVAYGTVLGTIKRAAPEGQFLNNVSQGATVSEYTLTEEETTIAKAAVEATGLDFGGADFIHTEDGPVVLEVNKGPQIIGFETVYGHDTVFKRIAEMIEEKNRT